MLSTLGFVPADFVRLVRHGEVNNPDRILYGRLDGFGLTARGRQMAERAAVFLGNRSIAKIVSSPLQRTQETATPLAEVTGIGVELDERVIEGSNQFQGSRVSASRLLRTPSLWPLLRNPLTPSWAEPYRQIASRMMSALNDAYFSVEAGDVVIVTHQLPIWMVHRSIAGVPLPHLPTSRRCTLGSVTTFHKVADTWREYSYDEPSKDLLVDAIDLGAV
jgi:broad specificity phosphatase PhoE